VKARFNEMYRVCNEQKVIGVEADGARYTVLIAPFDKLRARCSHSSRRIPCVRRT
jgi:hypothetical protein